MSMWKLCVQKQAGNWATVLRQRRAPTYFPNRAPLRQNQALPTVIAGSIQTVEWTDGLTAIVFIGAVWALDVAVTASSRTDNSAIRTRVFSWHSQQSTVITIHAAYTPHTIRQRSNQAAAALVCSIIFSHYHVTLW